MVVTLQDFDLVTNTTLPRERRSPETRRGVCRGALSAATGARGEEHEELSLGGGDANRVVWVRVPREDAKQALWVAGPIDWLCKIGRVRMDWALNRAGVSTTKKSGPSSLTSAETGRALWLRVSREEL